MNIRELVRGTTRRRPGLVLPCTIGAGEDLDRGTRKTSPAEPIGTESLGIIETRINPEAEIETETGIGIITAETGPNQAADTRGEERDDL